MAHIHSNALIGASGAAGAAGDTDYIIPKSLRFNSGDSSHLTRTPESVGNRRTWTWSAWVKRGKLGERVALFTAATDNTEILFEPDDVLRIYFYPGSYAGHTKTVASFRDTSAWYHIVFAIDTTQTGNDNIAKIYVNGVQQAVTHPNNWTQNGETNVNNTVAHYIGSRYGPARLINAYMADVQLVDGQQLEPTAFGETRSSDGVWVPKEASFTSPNDGTTWSNSTVTTGTIDSSYPLTNAFNGSIAQPNTRSSGANTTITITLTKAISFSSKVRIYQNQNGTANINSESTVSTSSGGGSWVTVFTGSGSLTSLTLTSTGGDTVSLMAIEVDGVILQDGLSNKYGVNGFHLNFSDSSTIEALGFDSAPTIPDLDPKKGMDVVTYSGNSTLHNIGGLSFEPGLVWLKTRTGHSSKTHGLFDVVRGPTKFLATNSTAAENSSYDNNLTAFNPDGFTLREEPDFNTSGRTYVGWCWRAGGPAVPNTDGTITAQVSANTDYGFSIISYTGTGSAATIGHGLSGNIGWVITKSRTTSNGWIVWHKSYSNSTDNYLQIDRTDAIGTLSNYWGSGGVTSSVIGLGTYTGNNTNNADMIAYCWSEVAGYSKFAGYAGTGANGNKQTTGFKPRWVLIKGTDSTYEWQIFDSERNPTNPRNLKLEPNTSDAEASTGNNVNFYDDGFDFNTNSDKLNGSSKNYIYAAFADRPGNNWDVNNIVTNEGLTTSKTQFDVVTYTGNGGTQKLGGEVYSNGVTGYLASLVDAATNLFDGDTSGNMRSGSTNGSGIKFVPATAITGSIELYLRNGDTANSTFSYSLDGGSNFTNLTTTGGSGSYVSIGSQTISTTNGIIVRQTTTSGTNEVNWRAIRVDGTVLLDGTGPGLSFQPDLIWLKGRSYSISHLLYDSVRGYGADKELVPNGTNAEGAAGADSTYGYVSAVDSSGFTIEGGSDADNGYTNKTNATYVAWCWKAGGTAVSNSNGSITSSVSANPGYGFSVVTWTGTATAGTIGHGLNGKVPKFIITKRRNSSGDWYCQHASLGATHRIQLNSSAARTSGTSLWNSTSPTGSVFSIGGDNEVNASGGTFVAYCFADIPGYQRIGSYTGNGSSTGPVVVTGFKPRFLLVKNTNASRNWVLWDTERANNDTLKANSSGAEESNYQVDALPNGFQIKNTWNEFNENGATILYLAIGDDEIGSDEDCLVDVPNAVTADADETDTTGGYQRGNYATLNPLDKSSGLTLSNGNLQLSTSSGNNNFEHARSTIGVTSGKWYCEFTTTNGRFSAGVATSTSDILDRAMGDVAGSFGIASDGSNLYKQGYPVNSHVNLGSTNVFAANDICGIAFDATNGTLDFYKNGVLISGASYTSLSTSETYHFVAGDSHNGSPEIAQGVINFGQMRFKYPIPTGYAALNTTALPAATIPDASVYFNTQLWTGNGADNRTVTGYGFQPDLAWIKVRNQNYNHNWQDAVIGTGSYLSTNNNTAATTENRHVKSFDSDGFTLGTGGFVNGNNDTYVGWAWDAGSSTVSNTSGSITSSVRANPSAGFSICKITTPSSDGAYTFGHGLNAVPELIIYRIYDQNMSWYVYHKGLGAANKYTLLNATNAANSGSYVFNNTYPTSTLVTDYAGNSSHHNEGRDMIYYCFAPVAGFSKIGTFVNPSSTDGAFVYCGFRPAFLLAKCAENISSSSGTGDWIIKDSKRSPSNNSSDNNTLVANVSNAEDAYYNASQAAVDFLSNGFKIRHNNTSPLGDPGRRYIFIAFAENPFQANGGLAR